ncbi:acyltransferase [Paraburkholderia sp. A2WS-5]|uniref:acyltransferase family protein n=1 Tax=Paraburkholderia sp. A2WS-5 TaxID=3028372 RepID=UPI003B7B74B4
MSLLQSHPAITALALIVASLALGGAIASKLSFFRVAIDNEIAARRFHAIDGLRGYLAIAVVIHHIGINYLYYQTGIWQITPSRVNTFLGHGAVAMFFMITALLFWSRVLTSNGNLDTRKFFVSRVRRMVPMYLLASGLVVVTAISLTHFKLAVGVGDFLRQVVSWGLFTIPGNPPINGFENTHLINTVFWSLAYEWKFYIMLPLLAIFASGKSQWALGIASGALIYLFSPNNLEWFFMAGCATAVVVRIDRVRQMAGGWFPAALAISCIAATLIWQPSVYTLLGAALLFVPFSIFACGNSIFGILTCRPARLLGLISYSVYLLHNWVLYLASGVVDHFTPVGQLAPVEYWSLGMLVLAATIILSLITFRFIEHPFIDRRNASTKQSEPIPHRQHIRPSQQ